MDRRTVVFGLLIACSSNGGSRQDGSRDQARVADSPAAPADGTPQDVPSDPGEAAVETARDLFVDEMAGWDTPSATGPETGSDSPVTSDVPPGMGGMARDGASSAGGTGGDGGPGGSGGTVRSLDGSPSSDGSSGAGGARDARDAANPVDVDALSGESDADNRTSYVSTLPLGARHLVYDKLRDRLFVSVASTAAGHPNSIVAIDPGTGTVVDSVWVGSEPNVLALSDDSSILWIGINGANAIRKLSLASPSGSQLGALCRLPLDASRIDYLSPQAMVVLPGAPLSVALVRGRVRPSDVVVLDDCVERPTRVDHTNTAPPLIFAGPPGYLFGLNGTYGALAVLAVNAAGITRSEVAGLIGDSQSGGFYADGRIYLSGGEVIDAMDMSAPTRAGAFGFRGPIAPLDQGHVLMLSSAQLKVLATDTFTQTASIALPDGIGGGADLTYAGADTAAFLSGGTVVLVHDRVLGNRPRPDGGIGGVGGGTGGTGGHDGGTGGSGGADGEECASCSFTEVPAFGRHMVFDPMRNLIYVTGDAAAKANPNSLVVVDPVKGSVITTVAVGGDPGPLALSDDASTLWIGRADDHSVQKITPGAVPTAGTIYPLPTVDSAGSTVAPTSIAVLPGTTSSVVVAANNTVSYVAFLLDDGIARPLRPPTTSLPAKFLVSGPAGHVYGFNYLVEFNVLTVSAEGIAQTEHPGLIEGTNIKSLAYSNRLVFTDDGVVIDVSSPASPLPLARYGYMGPIAVRDSDHLLMLTRETGSTDHGPVLRVLDTKTFACVATATVPVDVVGYMPLLDGMVYLGGDAIGFLVYESGSSHLYLMRAAVIGSPP